MTDKILTYEQEPGVEALSIILGMASRLFSSRIIPGLNADKEGDPVLHSDHVALHENTSKLLEVLETYPVKFNNQALPARFPVQYVVREGGGGKSGSARLAGRLVAGRFKVGDAILVMPGNIKTTIESIFEGDNQLSEANAPQDVSIRLSSDAAAERGHMLVRWKEQFPRFSSQVTLVICWLGGKPLQTGKSYIVRHTTDETRAVIESVRYKVNNPFTGTVSDDTSVRMNDIAHITIRTEKPLKFDDYSENRSTGSLLLIDETTFETAGAGMILSDPEVFSYNI